MLFLKNKNKTSILASKLNKFGIIILEAYSTKLISKKSAETIFTKLLTISGSDVVSAINPEAIINGKIIFSSNFNARTIASTIGVKISAVPSFANNAATMAPNIVTRKNIFAALFANDG